MLKETGSVNSLFEEILKYLNNKTDFFKDTTKSKETLDHISVLFKQYQEMKSSLNTITWR